MGKREQRNTLIKEAIAVFALFFLLSAVYFSQPTHFADEKDNFTAAMTLVRSGDIYKVFYSQHMPVMYYLCAVFYLLGARTAIIYRIYFAAFSTALWTAMYFRYSKRFGRVTMLLGPVVYLACLGQGEFTQTTVMADKLQAYGMAILLFEFLAFADGHSLERRLTISSCCWISFAIFISFGSAFVSVYGIFMVFVGVVLIELRECIRQQGEHKKLISLMAGKYWRLILIVAAPFAILLGWYAISGNLRNFIEQAYLLNMKIYSKYLGGYGANAIGTFVSCFTDFWSELISAINSVFTDPFASIWRLTQLLTVLCAAFYWGRRDKLRGIMVFLIIAYSVPRSYFWLHAMAQYLLCSYMFAFLMNKLFTVIPFKTDVSGLMICSVGGLICLLMLIPLFLNVGKLREIPGMFQREISSEAQDIRTIVDNGGTYAVLASFDYGLVTEVDRADIRTGESVPWFSEMFKDRDMERLSSEPPTVIVANEEYNVWDYYISDYAPELITYVEENYVNIYGDLWIRNEELAEVCELLGRDVPKELIMEDSGMSAAMPALVEGSNGYVQFFSAKASETLDYVTAAFGTYMRENQGELTVGLYSAADDTLLSETTADLSSFEDNQYGLIDLPDVALHEGEEYYLKFSVDYAGPEDVLTIYRTADNTATATDYAMLDGTVMDYSLCVQLYGDVG